ncbi:MAG: hypothetical protein AAFX99_06955, partial [Myxococcota bacterium]
VVDLATEHMSTTQGSTMDERTIAARLAEHEVVANEPGLAELGAAAFAYAAILLDDDDNLTRLGNPTGEAKKMLQARIEELLEGSTLDDLGDDDLDEDADVEAPDLDDIDFGGLG